MSQLWIAVEVDDKVGTSGGATSLAHQVLRLDLEGIQLGEALLFDDEEAERHHLVEVPEGHVSTTRPVGHRFATWPGYRDAEVDSLMHVNEVLDQLPAPARQRLVAYLFDRYGEADA